MRIAYCIGVLVGIALLACIGCDGSRTDGDAPDPAADNATGATEYADTGDALAPGTVTIELNMPEGYKLNDAAPTKVVLKAGDAPVTFADGKNEIVLEKHTFPAVMPVTFGSGAGTLAIEYVVHYCAEPSWCDFDTRHLMVEVSFGTQTVLVVESVFTKLR